MVLDPKTKACKPSKKGGAKRNNALAGARAESNPCKYGPKVDIGGKAKCPTRLLEANPAFKARYCKSGRYDLQIGKLPAYIVNPDPTGPRPRTCVRNPDVTKASKRSVMSGTAMSTRGFKIVNGQVVHVGLKKNDLVKNPRGRIVSKVKQAHGQKVWKAMMSTDTKGLDDKEIEERAKIQAKFLDQQSKVKARAGVMKGQVKGNSIAAMRYLCKQDGLVYNKKTHDCRASTKTSGGPTLKDLAAKCKAQGKVLEKVTKTCRDRKKAKKSTGPRKPRAVKGDSIAAMRYLCQQDGKVLNVKTKQCRDKKKAPRKSPRIAQAVSKAKLAALRLKCKEDGNQIYNQKTKQCRPRKSSGRKAAPKPRRSARIAAQ